jgi:hypothetical protein
MSEKRDQQIGDYDKIAEGEELSTDEILLEQQHNLYDFSFEAIDLDTKFRSMNTNDLDGFHNETNLFRSQQPQKFHPSVTPAATSGKGAPIFHDLSVGNLSKATSSQEATVAKLETIQIPPKPFYVNSLQFLCQLQLNDLFLRLESKLNSILEISYVFQTEKCCVSHLFLPLTCSPDLNVQWEGVYLRGSSRCKFELNLYKETSGGFVLEGNRLSVSSTTR